MSRNYEYIIAGLPDISPDWRGADADTVDSIIQNIKEQCSAADNKLIDILLDGYQDDKLNQEFYENALKLKNKFLRGYFRFDLEMRNAKVHYLNKALGRPADTDIFMELEDDSDETQKLLDAVLNTDDILQRERGLDDLMWAKIDALCTFHYFDMDVILGFIAKLHIVSRWLKLDPESGKAMFARLVNEVKGSYTGIREAADKAVS